MIEFTILHGIVSGEDETKDVISVTQRKKNVGVAKTEDLRGQAIQQVIRGEPEVMSSDVRSWGEEDACLCFIEGGE